MRHILSSAVLGLLALSPLASGADYSVRLGGNGIRIDRDHDRDYHRHHRDDDDRHRYGHRYSHREPSRLVSTSRRVIRERDGDKYVIVRRVYEQPDGDRIVRESREFIDR